MSLTFPIDKAVEFIKKDREKAQKIIAGNFSLDRKVSNELGIAAELSAGVTELKIVTNESLLHHEERSLMQWQSRYDSLLKLLRGGHFKNPGEQIFIDGILKIFKRFKFIFFYIFTDLERFGGSSDGQ